MANQDNDADSQRRDDCRPSAIPEEPSSDLLREMRREIDKLRSAIKEKTDRNLD